MDFTERHALERRDSPVRLEIHKVGPRVTRDMTRFLQSGRRRDICVLLADEPRQAQALKSRLESVYDVRIDPKSFYGALDTLVDGGHLELRESGIHDEYLLSDAGRAMLEAHVDWVRERVGDGDG
jgi:DNA-binding PadR family transcriptional regulator